MKKTIAIHLIKTLVWPLEDIPKLPHSLNTLYKYAPEDIYDYYSLGKVDCLMMLNTDVLTKDLVPLLRDFYTEFYDGEDLSKCECILKELSQYDTITCEFSENIGYQNADTFEPYYENDANPKPYHMYEERVKLDCTGIILKVIPPEEATFAMLYTLEKELQDKFSSHPLSKALKICVGYYSY